MGTDVHVYVSTATCCFAAVYHTFLCLCSCLQFRVMRMRLGLSAFSGILFLSCFDSDDGSSCYMLPVLLSTKMDRRIFAQHKCSMFRSFSNQTTNFPNNITRRLAQNILKRLPITEIFFTCRFHVADAQTCYFITRRNYL